MNTSADSIEQEIRSRVVATGLSSHRLAKLSGVSRASIVRFVAGNGVTLATAVRLARSVGLEITHQQIEQV